MPPLPGTPSYAAAAAMDAYFPSPALTVAMLIESPAGAMLRFTTESTCTLEPVVDLAAKSVGVVCKPLAADSLGGGCITKTDVLKQLAAGIENATAKFSNLQNLSRKIVAGLPALTASLPDIQLCPQRVPRARGGEERSLTDMMLGFAEEVNRTAAQRFPQCVTSTEAFSSLAAVRLADTLPVPELGANVTFDATIPAGSLWGFGADQLLADGGATALVAVSLLGACGQSKADADELASVLQELAARAPAGLRVRVSSVSLMLRSIQAGVSQTMNLSALTMPVALAILAAMVQNVRLVLCTVLNLAACFTSAVPLWGPHIRRGGGLVSFRLPFEIRGKVPNPNKTPLVLF